VTGVFVLDAVRTPIGRYGGGYADVRPDDLAATVLRGLVDRRPGLDPAEIDDVVLGDANGAGEDNRNVARMAVLLAGLPPSVPGVTVNRLCGSGLEAVIQASRAVATGDASLVIGGGVESMTRAPWVVPKPAVGFPRNDETLHSTTLGWRMVNPRMPDDWTIRLAEGAELLADRFKISREDQDRFALASHGRALDAWGSGRFDDEVVRLDEALLPLDESIRPDTSAEALAALRPIVRPDGTVTAGNASPLNDGASALLLADEATVNRLHAKPLARMAGRGVAANEPPLFGIAPVAAAEAAL
jgi:acetyl-CoA acetyltransferase family protein